MQKFGIEGNFEIKSIIQYYAQWIKEGKLKVNSDWNKERQIKFTVQDPCQLVRKTFGDPVAEDLRYVTEAVVGQTEGEGWILEDNRMEVPGYKDKKKHQQVGQQKEGCDDNKECDVLSVFHYLDDLHSFSH